MVHFTATCIKWCPRKVTPSSTDLIAKAGRMKTAATKTLIKHITLNSVHPQEEQGQRVLTGRERHNVTNNNNKKANATASLEFRDSMVIPLCTCLTSADLRS